VLAMEVLTFPKDFIFGVSTSAYQIEGAADEDGRGPSVWDTFSKLPGRTWNNDNGDKACDHYHRYVEDIKLMKELNLDAYVFTISWPRIFPEGEGKPNPKGIDFYERLVDELLKNDIKPFATLFHWDLPQALQDKYGGWKSKDVSKLFSDYTAFVVDKLKDRVEYWITINEISCFTILAHKYDIHAPGGIEPEKIVNQTVHNALLGHGLAARIIHEISSKLKVGLVENLSMVWPVYEEEKHINAARKAFYDKNQQILFPAMRGKYSEEWLKKIGKDAPDFNEEELKIIGERMDFIGYNMYTGEVVRHKDNEDGYEVFPYPQYFPKTYMGWPITPKAIYACLKFSTEFFGNEIPIYITENGMAAKDVETKDGEVLDIERIEFLRQHLEQVARALNEGINLKGYFVWSLLDNFEWAEGYDKRFGLVRVNYSSQKRTIKLSGEYYRNVIKSRRVL
ncbi:MAG: GH1 family beta-glucosidase, partial [Brevinematia bacterium]